MLSILRVKGHYFYLSVPYSAPLISSNTPGQYQIWFCLCYFSSNSPASCPKPVVTGSLLTITRKQYFDFFYFYLLLDSCFLSLMSSFLLVKWSTFSTSLLRKGAEERNLLRLFTCAYLLSHILTTIGKVVLLHLAY